MRKQTAAWQCSGGPQSIRELKTATEEEHKGTDFESGTPASHTRIGRLLLLELGSFCGFLGVLFGLAGAAFSAAGRHPTHRVVSLLLCVKKKKNK